MPAALGNLIGNQGNKMGPQPNGGQPNPAPQVPAGLQQGNTPSNLMQHLSGLLGGGDPSQDQNNAYIQGKVNEYMANKQAVQARAQQKGAAATQRELQKGNAQLTPPQLAQPGTGVTPSSPLQQLWQQVQSRIGMK